MITEGAPNPRVEILVEQHILEVMRGVEPAMHLRHRGDVRMGTGPAFFT